MAALIIRAQAAGNISANDFSTEVQLPKVEVRLGIGFNYDLLHDPLDVSFEYPRGYFGMNLPLEKSVNVRDYTGYIQPGIDTMFADSSLFTNADEFRPTAGARQNPNPTIRVDVPMLGGVASFISTQNFFIDYSNLLGNPNIFISPDSLENLNFLLRGTVNVPVNLTASWESMTFGYAFEVNRYVRLAFNLSRHIFTMNVNGKVDVDLLGRYDISMGSSSGTSGFDVPSINGELDYSSDKIYGEVYGHYEAETWSPTVAFKAWRLSVISRFGIDARARGKFFAKYSVPFFIDPETFGLAYDFSDPAVLTSSEVRQGLLSNASDSIVYSTRKLVNGKYVESDLRWRMPTGLTFAFDIIPEKLKFSYTKLFGEVSMKLDRIGREQVALETGTTRENSTDSVIIDYGIRIDHVMVAELNLFNSYLNLGVFGMDFRYGDKSNLLGSQMKKLANITWLGNTAMLPILSLGTRLGTRVQLALDLNILPLPALKTGVVYFF
jgi:hypothetical protein